MLAKKLGIEHRVHFPGVVSNVAERIKNAKLFVITSDYEGMPNALMEAMAIGLPVIATDCDGGGVQALIKNEENGLIIPKNDEAALVAAMRRVLLDPEFAQRIGVAARNSTLMYSEKNIAIEWLKYFDSIL